MGLFNFLFGNDNDIKSGEKKVIKFQRIYVRNLPLNTGDSVRLWNKPHTNLINVYVTGLTGGSELIGQTENSSIAQHLSNKNSYKAKIYYIGDSTIEIDVHFEDSKVTYQKQLISQQEALKRCKEQLMKKHNPKTFWYIDFNMTENFDKSCPYKIGCNDIDTVLSNIQSLEYH